MDEERIFLNKEQAIDCLVINEGQVHNFIPAPFGIIGADWGIKDVEKCFDEADSIEIGGSQCRAMKHGIAVVKGENAYFFESNEEKLKKYEKEGK